MRIVASLVLAVMLFLCVPALTVAQQLGVGVANGGTLISPPGVKWGGKLVINFGSGCAWNNSTKMVDCSFSAGSLSNPMTTTGDLIVGGGSGTPNRLAVNATATVKYLKSVSGATSLAQPACADLSDAGTGCSATIGSYLALAGGTMTGKLNTLTSGTGGAGLNLPHGAAPTSPSNGDVWTTTAGIYVRINGATVGPLGTGAWVEASRTLPARTSS